VRADKYLKTTTAKELINAKNTGAINQNAKFKKGCP